MVKKIKNPIISLLDPRLKFISLTFINNILIANTKEIFAIFDPNAFPKAILGLFSKLERIEINISGEDVASPIKIKLDINREMLKYLESFSVEDTK